MRGLIIIISLLLTPLILISQERETEYTAFKEAIKVAASDTARINAWLKLSRHFSGYRTDSGIYYAMKGLKLAREIDYHKGELRAIANLPFDQNAYRNYPKVLALNLEGLKKAQEYNDTLYIARFRLGLGLVFGRFGEYEKALQNLRVAHSLYIKLKFEQLIIISKSDLALALFRVDKIDSAFYHAYSARNLHYKLKKKSSLGSIEPFSNLGIMHFELNNIDSSLFYFGEAHREGSETAKSEVALQLANVFHKINMLDSAIYYAGQTLDFGLKNKYYVDIVDGASLLSKSYENSNNEKALSFSRLANAYRDTIVNIRELNSYNDVLIYDEQQRSYEIEKARREYRNEVKTEVLSAAFLVLLIIAFLLYRNNRIQKKSKRKTEVAYERLKNTQTQLIHSEKMASLGELTAGIAHEIQNPLNFVNNFSEINKEMLAELRDAVASNDQEEVEAILKDLEDNEDKVTHHGKRAEQIVKSMLQHSRTGSGEKEITDINALCDEYLRLSYHGYRAKDKSFQSDFKLDLDPELPKINVVPQDIGRVLLNLINNAFQAVYAEASAKAGGDYKPLVSVITKLDNHQINISVKDNGPGIPDDIKDKIFQPFFTTKPTGEGTGLGLSMSYDIATKGHGGELTMNSNEGEGSEFVIRLPLV